MAQSLKYTLIADPEPTKRQTPAKLSGTKREVVDALTFGKGVITPFQRDGKGDFANAADISLVRSEVQQVLGTMASSPRSNGELPWRPEFGSILPLLRFRNLDETTRELARVYVIDALRTWLSRVRVKDAQVDLDFDLSALIITVRYDVLAVTSRSTIAVNQTATVSVAAAA